MGYETVILEIEDGIATLTLNRPEALNAMNMQLLADAREAVIAAQADENARVLVITGAGRGFCSGADLAAAPSDEDKGLSTGERTARRMETAFNPLIREIYECDLPVITAINGVAAGGGAGLALLGDIAIAAKSAKFIQVFTPKLGIIPDLGCTWHLPRLVGRARAMGLAVLGDPLTAEQAAEWGLIWKCVDDDRFADEVREYALRFASGPTRAYAETRKAFDRGEHNTLAEQLDYERDVQRVLTNAPNFVEGVMAFMQKREPVFARE